MFAKINIQNYEHWQGKVIGGKARRKEKEKDREKGERATTTSNAVLRCLCGLCGW